MLSKSISIFLICLGLCFSTSMNAVMGAESDSNTEPHTINLRNAIAKTFEHNPSLRSFSHQLKAQGGRELQAGMSASPEVTFLLEDALGTGVFEGTDNAQATLSIGWVLEGETRQGYKDVARAGTLSLTAESNLKRLDAAAETARLYLICLANQSRLINAEKTVSLAKKTVSAVKKRVAAGKTPDAELSRARAEAARRQLEYEDIEHELSSAIHLLAAQWGVINPAFTQVAGSISILPVITSFEVLKTQLEQSPEFTRLLSDKRLKQAELKLAESQSGSNWRVNLGVSHYEAPNDQALVAGITIPFGERSRNTGRITEARENLSQSTAKEDELRVRFETSLYVLYQELQHNLHRIDAYRNDIIPQLENALKQTSKAYDLGRYSYFEWRSVQAELLDARSALVEDSIAVHLKVIEIERLTGISMTQATSN
jgi:cobalt-zinc-cadmium efflux system outer membrane protein